MKEIKVGPLAVKSIIKYVICILTQCLCILIGKGFSVFFLYHSLTRYLNSSVLFLTIKFLKCQLFFHAFLAVSFGILKKKSFFVFSTPVYTYIFYLFLLIIIFFVSLFCFWFRAFIFLFISDSWVFFIFSNVLFIEIFSLIFFLITSFI